MERQASETRPNHDNGSESSLAQRTTSMSTIPIQTIANPELSDVPADVTVLVSADETISIQSQSSARSQSSDLGNNKAEEQSQTVHFLYLITNVFQHGIKAGRSFFYPNKVFVRNSENITDVRVLRRAQADKTIRKRYNTPYGTKIIVQTYIVGGNTGARERCFHEYVGI